MSLPVTKLQWVLLSCATELGYRCWIARSRASELRTLIGMTSHSRMMQTMTVSDVRVYSHLATDLHRRKGRGSGSAQLVCIALPRKDNGMGG